MPGSLCRVLSVEFVTWSGLMRVGVLTGWRDVTASFKFYFRCFLQEGKRVRRNGHNVATSPGSRKEGSWIPFGFRGSKNCFIHCWAYLGSKPTEGSEGVAGEEFWKAGVFLVSGPVTLWILHFNSYLLTRNWMGPHSHATVTSRVLWGTLGVLLYGGKKTWKSKIIPSQHQGFTEKRHGICLSSQL